MPFCSHPLPCLAIRIFRTWRGLQVGIGRATEKPSSLGSRGEWEKSTIFPLCLFIIAIEVAFSPSAPLELRPRQSTICRPAGLLKPPDFWLWGFPREHQDSEVELALRQYSTEDWMGLQPECSQSSVCSSDIPVCSIGLK